MVERFTFADTETGLTHAMDLTLSMRQFGFKTRVVSEVMGHTRVYVLVAVPPRRANRAGRGCNLGGR